MKAHVLAFATVSLSLACAPRVPPPEPADLVIRGGSILTLAEPARVEAVAVRDGRIVELGLAAELEALIGPATKVIELNGAVAMPGFVESHAHLLGMGLQRLQLDLRDARSWEEIVERCRRAAAAAEQGDLITGRGWHQDKFDQPPADAVAGWPRHDLLSAATPENPVVLEHASGHATFANAAAMEAAGIDRTTENPEGGTIVRDGRGNAIGVFVETAAGLLPNPEGADLDRLVELAQEEILSHGITTFVDAGSTIAEVEHFRALADAGRLRLRLSVLLRDSNAAIAAALPGVRMVDHQGVLTVRGIKHWIDGALGSRGAWLLEPYSDAPETSGLNTTSLDEIRESARLALEHDLQLAVHAIGDRANREVLDLYEQAFAAVPGGGTALRWRIEHAQHLHPDEIPRFTRLGVIASMQGVHCTSDGPWVPDRLGVDRAREGAYVWQKLLNAGATIVNGTDAPVESVSPIASFAASVTRLMNNGQRFFPEQAMSREQALRSYTLDGAYGTFAEADRGSLVVGKLADIAVLDRDPLTVPEAELPTLRALQTIVGGQVVWEQGREAPE